jgi:hypothetical protein
MQPGESADHITAADEERVADSVSATLDSGKNLTRPGPARQSALGTAASVVRTTEAGGGAGRCCPCVLPNRLVRSHVENGAVNGRMTSATSQTAKNFGTIAKNVVSSTP